MFVFMYLLIFAVLLLCVCRDEVTEPRLLFVTEPKAAAEVGAFGGADFTAARSNVPSSSRTTTFGSVASNDNRHLALMALRNLGATWWPSI